MTISPPPADEPASPPPSPLAAVILAGGASSRMGTPKAWLDWRGKPLLRHLAELFVAYGARVVVVGVPGEPLPALPAGARRVDDPPGERGGPLVGLATGLSALEAAAAGATGAPARPGELVFLSACDNVFLSAAHLDHLRDRLLAEPTIDAVLPVDPAPADGSPAAPAVPRRIFAHPLAAALRLGPAAAAARALVAAGIRRPIALFDRLATATIPSDQLPDPQALATCNTPEEYAAACARDTDPPASGDLGHGPGAEG